MRLSRLSLRSVSSSEWYGSLDVRCVAFFNGSEESLDARLFNINFLFE